LAKASVAIDLAIGAKREESGRYRPARPLHLQGSGGGNSFGVPQDSSHWHIASCEIVPSALIDARASAIARRFASRLSVGRVVSVLGIANARMG
jgi:hypothetical protein